MTIEYKTDEGEKDKRYILYVYYPHEGMYVDSNYDTIDELTESLKKTARLANSYQMYDRVEGVTYDIKITK